MTDEAAADGIDADERAFLDSLDFHVLVEGPDGTDQHPEEFAWVDSRTVYFRWTFQVQTSDGRVFGETFDLVVGDFGGPAERLIASERPPAFASIASSHALTADPVMRLDGEAIAWETGPSPRRAVSVGGALRVR